MVKFDIRSTYFSYFSNYYYLKPDPLEFEIMGVHCMHVFSPQTVHAQNYQTICYSNDLDVAGTEKTTYLLEFWSYRGR